MRSFPQHLPKNEKRKNGRGNHSPNGRRHRQGSDPDHAQDSGSPGCDRLRSVPRVADDAQADHEAQQRELIQMKRPETAQNKESLVKDIGRAVMMNVTVLVLSSLAFKGISYVFRRVIAS